MAKGVQLRLMAASDWEACRALCGAGFGGAQCELPSQDVLKRFLARNPLKTLGSRTIVLSWDCAFASHLRPIVRRTPNAMTGDVAGHG